MFYYWAFASICSRLYLMRAPTWAHIFFLSRDTKASSNCSMNNFFSSKFLTWMRSILKWLCIFLAYRAFDEFMISDNFFPSCPKKSFYKRLPLCCRYTVCKRCAYVPTQSANVCARHHTFSKWERQNAHSWVDFN